jgi:hypothetical protein
MAFVNIQHVGLYYTIKLHDSSEDVQMWQLSAINNGIDKTQMDYGLLQEHACFSQKHVDNVHIVHAIYSCG